LLFAHATKRRAGLAPLHLLFAIATERRAGLAPLLLIVGKIAGEQPGKPGST